MNSDSFFTIGSTHLLCQDYALSGSFDKMAYAVLSDGCSTGVDTDWGARLLAKCAEIAIKNGDGDKPEVIIMLADCHRRGLRLHDQSLLATLGIVTLNDESSYFESRLYGDGYLIGRRRNKTFVITSLNYTSGAPYYLNYNFTPGSREEYLQKLGYGRFVIKTIDTACDSIQEQESPVEDHLNGFSYNFPREEFDLVAVVSDGLDHFVRKVRQDTSIINERVADQVLVNEIMNIKGYTGSFMKRRCHKAFEKFRDMNYINQDDFSIGVVYDG